jgi:hypothetical protein
MKNFKAIAVAAIFLSLFAGLLMEHRSRSALNKEMLSLKSELARLEERMTASQPEREAVSEPSPSVTIPADRPQELLGLRATVNELRQKLSDLEQANATVSNQMASARGPEVPLIYPDAKKRKDYVFAGYSVPERAFQSVLWAITQSDAKTFQASITGDMAAGFASSFQDLPDGVMPGGFRNGEMFKASGYRVLEEAPLSDDEFVLKVFLEGSRMVIKPVFKKVDGEWKWARNEP